MTSLSTAIIPIVVGVVLDHISSIGSGIAVVIAVVGAVVVGGITFLVSFLVNQVSILRRERLTRANQVKALAKWAYRRFETMKIDLAQLSDRIVRPQYESYVLRMKENIEVLSKHREIVIDFDAEGRDLGVTRQEISLAQPGDPVVEFPVIITTNVLETTFEKLQYEVGPTASHTPGEYSRAILVDGDKRLLQFAIRNTLVEPLHHGRVVEFWHRTCANLLKPEKDWVGIEAGGIALRISAKIWFPDDTWHVTECCAYKGVPGDDNKEMDPNPAKLGTGVYGSEQSPRTFIEWARANPEPNQRYFVEWKARKT